MSEEELESLASILRQRGYTVIAPGKNGMEWMDRPVRDWIKVADLRPRLHNSVLFHYQTATVRELVRDVEDGSFMRLNKVGKESWLDLRKVLLAWGLLDKAPAVTSTPSPAST